jgi:transposase
VDAGVAAVIRIDAMWLAVEPMDMRAGADRLVARVVEVFGVARAHHGYLFTNARGTRVKLVVHDGFGVWCAARRLNQGRFAWPSGGSGALPALTRAQFEALVVGLPERRFIACWPNVQDQPISDVCTCLLGLKSTVSPRHQVRRRGERLGFGSTV